MIQNGLKAIGYWFREQYALWVGDLAEAIYWEQQRKRL